EGDPPPAGLEQVPGAPQPAVEVVGADQVPIEPARVAAEVALDEDDGQPRRPAGAQEPLGLEGADLADPRRHEEEAGDARREAIADLALDLGGPRFVADRESVGREPDTPAPRDRLEAGEGDGVVGPRPGPRGRPEADRPALAAHPPHVEVAAGPLH